MGLCDIGLWTVLVTSFLSATLLPGGSEALVAGVVYCHPEMSIKTLLVATIGNTAGGMTSYAIGRIFRPPPTFRYLETVRHYGAISMILAWAPIIGDLLCVTAGWLRVPWLASVAWMAIGKAARYAVVIGVMSAL